MRIEALRDLTRDELLQKREELMQELFKLKLRRGFSELDNPLKLRVIRREIARVETILTEDRCGIRKIVDEGGLLTGGENVKKEK